MGMTVDGVSYLTGMRPNTHVSTTGKQEPKEAAADIGKTQKNSISASLNEANMGQDGIAITEVSRQQGTERSSSSIFLHQGVLSMSGFTGSIQPV